MRRVCIKRAVIAIFCAAALPAWLSAATAEDATPKEYIYSRDLTIPPFQKLHEFFDMPDRPGHYEATIISEAIGPITFHLIRVHDGREHSILQHRSYKLGDHEFSAPFDNPSGKDDLIVEIANSNPIAAAKVSVYVVELRE